MPFLSDCHPAINVKMLKETQHKALTFTSDLTSSFLHSPLDCQWRGVANFKGQ